MLRPVAHCTSWSGLSSPLVYKGSLFTIPQGKYKVADGEVVLQVDLDSLASKTYAFDQPAMNDVTVSDEYVFTCNTLNNSINRCRIEDGDLSKVALEGVYVTKIVWREGSLYAFGLSLDGNSSMIYCYDEDLALKEIGRCTDTMPKA
ncbi:hypothetical protein [Eggerthella lenta]|nr:hypothetical protein [Eggerthella lenta]